MAYRTNEERAQGNCTITVDRATRDLAKELAQETGVRIKEMVAIALVNYALTKQNQT
jgi:hypothetical protein